MSGKLSRLPSLVAFIAKDAAVSIRTVERWCKSGKVPGAFRTKGGHWRLRKPRGNDWLENASKLLAADVVRRLKVLLPHYDEAVELTFAAAAICDYDILDVTHPDPVQRKRNREALKSRDYRKWQLLCRRDFFDIHPEAFKALSQPVTKLRVKAARLRLNGYKVTSRSLADALGISISTLYRRFGGKAVRNARYNAPACDEAPARVRYQLTGLE